MLRIGAGHFGAAVTEVRFGPVATGSLPVAITGTVPAEGYGALFAPALLALEVAATVEPLRITGESAVDDYPNLGEATRLADRLVETAAYHPARLQDGCVVLDPRW